MIEELVAAAKAADAYEPRNEVEAHHVKLIRALLSDAGNRAQLLDAIVDEYGRAQRLQAAQAELAAAQQG